MKKSLLAALLSISLTAYAGDTLDQTMAELVAARDAITNAIVQKGGTVTSGALTNVPNEILSIPSGGGGGGPFNALVEGSIEEVTAQDLSGITSIRDYAFQGCSSLSSVTFPNGLESIGSYAFANTILNSVSFPASLTSVGDSAFSSCSGLTDVTIPAGVSFGRSAFSMNGLLTNAVFESGVTEIPDDFLGTCGLQSTTIPNTVTRIGAGAFCYNSELQSISIPNSVTSMGPNPFDGDDNLIDTSTITDIKLVDGWVVGRGEEGETTYDLSEARGVCDGAFSWADSVTEVTLPANMVSIGNETFQGCSSLESITIPNTVTTIGNNAFQGCSVLASVTMSTAVTSIGEYAFETCPITSISLPNTVTEIGGSAFSQCSSLTSFTVPTAVTAIPLAMLQSCNLTSITIPDAVESIGDYAFAANLNLETIDFGTTRSTIPTLDGTGAFENLPVSYQILVPSSLLDDWKEADVWNDENIVGHIVAHP